MKAEFIDLGLIEYKKAWDLQESYNSEVFAQREEINDLIGKIIFCEHPHVYTLGKSGQFNNLLINNDFLKKIKASYYKSNRGGDITYHGPGQIVGYPIVDLNKLKVGVKTYIRQMEEAIINTLKDYNIQALRMENATGVWLDVGTNRARKICAIGVRVSRAVTMHGFALNVNTDLKYFSYINPCGFIDKGVTSMQKELGKEMALNDVKKVLKKNFAELFNINFY